MNPSSRQLKYLWIAATTITVTGFFATAFSLAGMASRVDSWRRKSKEIGELQALALKHRQSQEGLAAHDKWSGQPPALEGLLNSFFPHAAPAGWKRVQEPVASGWLAEHVTFNLSDVPAKDVIHFLAAAASNTPPWILESGYLQSGTASGYVARIELTLSSMRRTAAPGEN